jgi:hypothetical protein
MQASDTGESPVADTHCGPLAALSWHIKYPPTILPHGHGASTSAAQRKRAAFASQHNWPATDKQLRAARVPRMREHGKL